MESSERSGSVSMDTSLSKHMKKAGIVYLIGAGPGNPDLITLRGRELIESADVLIYDALVSPDMLAWAPTSCKKIYAGKRASSHAMPQQDMNRLLVEEASKGQRVVRLKGGDPFVFGRGAEEAEAIDREGIAFEIVPGVTSAIAGPAYAGIPVTHRRHTTQFTVMTGHEDPGKGVSTLDLEGIARIKGTKVILMGVSSLDSLLGGLVSHGQSPETPAAAVEWATTGRQRTITGTVSTLSQLASAAGLKAPAVIIIGEVVTEQEHLNWFERLPLFGKRIVVTRTREQAGELSRKLRRLGAEVIELPTIAIEAPTDKRQFAELVVDAHRYEWLIFSSPNGVDRFFQGFFAVYEDIRSIGGARIAAIGPATAAKLRKLGLAVDLLPVHSVAEGLVKAFRDSQEQFGSIEHRTMLWVRAENSRDVISTELSAMQAIVDECIAYKTVPDHGDTAGAQQRLKDEGADIITFTSSSTAENFFQLKLPWPKGCKAASIGPVTSDTLAALGHKPEIKATKYDIDGLVDAIVKAVAKKR